MTNKRSIAFLIKPASSLCNMRCKYCFYHDVADNRQIQSYGIMKEADAEKLIQRVFEYSEEYSGIHFAFQGGEPTLAGLEFFKFFIDTVNTYKNTKQKIHYSMQTNGLLIDEAWCEFLKNNDFLIGLSLDCNSEIHDMHRVDAFGAGTYTKVIKAIKIMDKYKVEYNILSVVTRAMARKPGKVFKEYLKAGYKYLQFIPCLEPFDTVEGGDADRTAANKYSLSPEDYAGFLIETFRQWKHQLEVGNYISIRIFDNLIMVLKGYPPEQCGFLGKCSHQRVIEADGSVYPCDFYVLDEYNCGNIQEMSFDEIDVSGRAAEFLKNNIPVHPDCGNCRVRHLCGGGCKRYGDFYHSKSGYCPYREFLYEVYNEAAEVASKLS